MHNFNIHSTPSSSKMHIWSHNSTRPTKQSSKPTRSASNSATLTNSSPRMSKTSTKKCNPSKPKYMSYKTKTDPTHQDMMHYCKETGKLMNVIDNSVTWSTKLSKSKLNPTKITSWKKCKYPPTKSSTKFKIKKSIIRGSTANHNPVNNNLLHNLRTKHGDSVYIILALKREIQFTSS